MRFKIALRNIFRNFRRTLISVSMIAFGVTAIVLFKGFSHEMIRSLRDNLIANDIGHMQIADKKFWNNSSNKMSEYLIGELEGLYLKVKQNPEVTTVSGRLSFFGLISNLEKSVATRAIGINPEVESVSIKSLVYTEGGPLTLQNKMEIILGADLAQSLNVHIHDNLTLLTNTVDGVMNAVDAEVVGFYRSGIAEIDKTTCMISLKTAQILLDTDKVEKMVVTIKDTENTNSVLEEISANLKDHPELEGRSWHQISKFFREVEDFYAVYNGVIEVIILTVVLISILNTVSMSIFERVGEIGTLRALGDSRTQIIFQFTLEGFFLGVLGSLVGVVLSVIFAQVLNYLRLPMAVPGASVPLPILIDLIPKIILKTVLGLIVTTIIAAIIPALRATKIDIVEALKRNV
jgi:putative ABC transport system permease protein